MDQTTFGVAILTILTIIAFMVFASICTHIAWKINDYYWTHPQSKLTHPKVTNSIGAIFIFIAGCIVGSLQTWPAGWEGPVFVVGILMTILFALVFYIHRKLPFFLVYGEGRFTIYSIILIPAAIMGIFIGAWLANIL